MWQCENYNQSPRVYKKNYRIHIEAWDADPFNVWNAEAPIFL